VLDWSVFRQRMWLTEKTVHNVAKTLESIDKNLKALARADRIQRVAAYDGPELDQQRAQEHARRMRELEELEAELRPAQTAPPHPETGH
jgi:hypothetical protein